MAFDVAKFTQTKQRSMPVILLLDVSDSMNIVEGGDYIRTGKIVETDGHRVELVEGDTISRIDYLNNSVKAMIKAFQEQANNQIPIQICVITFGQKVEQWLPLTNVLDIRIDKNLNAGGDTPLKEALELAKSIIEDKNQISSKDYRPCVVLVSDGEPNPNWEQMFKQFITEGRSSKCDRWAVSIGKDADKKMLNTFVAENSSQLLESDDASEIAECFKLITMSVLTRSKSQDPNLLFSIEDKTAISAMESEELRISQLFQF